MVLGMIILATDFGLLGLLLAPPLVLAVQIFGSHLMRQSVPTTAPKPALQVDHLQERLAALQTMIAELDEPPLIETANMLARLSNLIEKAEQTLPPELPLQRLGEPVQAVYSRT
jgi:hypothetical protein